MFGVFRMNGEGKGRNVVDIYRVKELCYLNLLVIMFREYETK